MDFQKVWDLEMLGKRSRNSGVPYQLETRVDKQKTIWKYPSISSHIRWRLVTKFDHLSQTYYTLASKMMARIGLVFYTL